MCTSGSAGLKSSHAKAIAKVLGECPDDVKLLDAASIRIKTSKRNLVEHKRLLAVLQQRVLTRRAQVRSTIEDWEKCFYAHHKRLPTLHEDTEYHMLIKTREHIRTLLCTWQIAV